MFEGIIRKRHALQRLESSPAGHSLAVFAEYLRGRGHPISTIQPYLQAAEHFVGWLDRRGVLPSAVDKAMVRMFVDRHLPRCRCATPCGRTVHVVRAALHQYVDALRSPDFTGSQREMHPASEADGVVAEFDAYLGCAQGLSDATRRYRRRYATDFLCALFRGGPIDLSTLTPAQVRRFVIRQGKKLSPGSVNVLASSLRSLLRFFQFRGQCAPSLVLAVPGTAHWRLASLPKTLSERELQTLLGAFDQGTASGLRDFAMSVCMCDMGLRAAEVSALSLDDIEWRSCLLTIRKPKERRETRLPMPSRVALAIAQYLRRARPTTRDRAVFVHHRAPKGTRVSPLGVRSAVIRAAQRAQLSTLCAGPHVLRHTAATRMLRGGATLKEISDVLRHRSVDTTAIYAKVDLLALASVALPWPEVRS